MRELFSKSIISMIFMIIMMVVFGYQVTNAQSVTTETTTDQLTDDQKKAFLAGNLNAYVPGFRDEDGSFRMRPYLSISVGADYRPEDAEFAPRGAVLFGVETPHSFWELSGEGTIMRFPETSESPNRHYTSFGGEMAAGWKLWQSDSHSNYLAVVAAGGYMRYKSDREDGHLYVSGHGPTFRGGLRGKIAISPRCGLSMEAGWQRLPYQLHPENGTKWGKASHGAIYLKLGIQVGMGRRR